MIDLKLAFRSLKKRYHGNQFLALSTQLSFSDIRLMALALSVLVAGRGRGDGLALPLVSWHRVVQTVVYNRLKSGLNGLSESVCVSVPVSGEYERGASLADPRQRVPEVTASYRVHPGRRFVEEHDVRTADQSDRSAQLPPVAAAETLHVAAVVIYDSLFIFSY